MDNNDQVSDQILQKKDLSLVYSNPKLHSSMGFRANDSPERKAANLVEGPEYDVYANLE